MTAEYLDKSSLVARMKYYEEHTTEGSGEHYAYSAALREIRNAPAADVAPVRHGRWIKDEFFSDEVNNGEKCSQCGELIGWFGNLPKYCPGCGALMDGGN